MSSVAVAIFVPTWTHPDRHLCEGYCIRRGYHVFAVTVDPHAVARMYADGEIEKVIVAWPEHLAELIADAEVVTVRPDLNRDGYRTRRVPRSRAGR